MKTLGIHNQTEFQVADITACDEGILELSILFKDIPLICAQRNGHLKVVEYFISVGADKEAKSRFGWTPLFYPN